MDMNIMSEIIRDGGMVHGGNLDIGEWMENLCGKWNSSPVTPPVAHDGGVPLGPGEDYACQKNAIPESRVHNVNGSKENKDKIGRVGNTGGNVTHAIALENVDTSQSGRNTLCQRKFKGVTWYKRTKRWEAYVWATIDDKAKQYHLGSFSSQEEAAKAYDLALIKLRGNKAKTNFPREMYNEDDFLAEHSKDNAKDFIIALKNEFLLRQGLKPRAHAAQKRKTITKKDDPKTKKSKVMDKQRIKSGIKQESPNPFVNAPVAGGRYAEPVHHESLWRPEDCRGGYHTCEQFPHTQGNLSRARPQMNNNNNNNSMCDPGLGMNHAARMGVMNNYYLAALPPNLQMQQQQQPMQGPYLGSMVMSNHFPQIPMPAETVYQPGLSHNSIHATNNMGNVSVNNSHQYRSMSSQDVRGDQLKDLLNMEDLLQIDWKNIFPDEYAA